MPDAKKQTGVEHFEEAARVAEETSSDGRFSTYETVQGTGGDGLRHVQERHEPTLDERK